MHFYFDQNGKSLFLDIHPQIKKCQTRLLPLPDSVPFGGFILNPDNAFLEEVPAHYNY